VTLRAGHGTGAGQPRIEVLPVDELPAGLPVVADAVSRTAAAERGRFGTGNARSALGGRARSGKTRLARALGLADLAEGSDFAPYRRSATAFRRAQCATLATTVGGGLCGPGPSSMVASAALQLAWSRYLADQAAVTGDPKLALASSRLADASRQNLLAAHELCALEAQSRAEANPGDAHEELARALAEGR
jgi:hypothetical protein